MSFIVAAPALLAALLGPAPAPEAQIAAAPATAIANLPDWHQPRYRGNLLSAQFFQGMGYCLVTKSPAKALALASSPPGSRAQWKAAQLLSDEASCVRSGRVPMQLHLLSGAVAEALLEAKHWLTPAQVPTAPHETRASFLRELMAGRDGSKLHAQVKRNIIGRWAAHCTVRANAIAVESLLDTRPGSPGELKTLDGLRATLSSCLGPRLKLAASAPEMRAYLAEALYWRRSAEGVPNA